MQGRFVFQLSNFGQETKCLPKLSLLCSIFSSLPSFSSLFLFDFVQICSTTTFSSLSLLDMQHHFSIFSSLLLFDFHRNYCSTTAPSRPFFSLLFGHGDNTTPHHTSLKHQFQLPRIYLTKLASCFCVAPLQKIYSRSRLFFFIFEELYCCQLVELQTLQVMRATFDSKIIKCLSQTYIKL